MTSPILHWQGFHCLIRSTLFRESTLSDTPLSVKPIQNCFFCSGKPRFLISPSIASFSSGLSISNSKPPNLLQRLSAAYQFMGLSINLNIAVIHNLASGCCLDCDMQSTCNSWWAAESKAKHIWTFSEVSTPIDTFLLVPYWRCHFPISHLTMFSERFAPCQSHHTLNKNFNRTWDDHWPMVNVVERSDKCVTVIQALIGRVQLI